MYSKQLICYRKCEFLIFFSLLWASRQQGHDSSSHWHSSNIVDNRRKTSQNVKRANNQDGQEQSIVVKDAESSGLIFCHFIFLPKDTFIFFLSWNLLVSRIQLEKKDQIEIHSHWAQNYLVLCKLCVVMDSVTRSSSFGKVPMG